MSAFSRGSKSSSSSKVVSLGIKVVAIGASALLLASCASGSGSSSSAGAKSLDLKLGTILPQTGSLAVLGPPEFAGVDLAIKDINAAGVGLKATVEHKDSGDTTTDIATQSATALLADGVQAIVGAASSGVSKTFIDQVTKAKVIQISPANTSPDFTAYKDGGYYWRTAPSDVLQGQIMGNKLVQDGKTNVSILYMNDAYGIGLQTNIKKTLDAAGVTNQSVTYDPAAANFTAEVGQVLAPKPDALVVIGFEESKTIYAELATKGFPFKNLYGTDGNYGLMQPGQQPDIAGAQYTNPGVKATDAFQAQLQDVWQGEGNPKLTTFSYAAESYDATVVVALAALQGGATDGPTIQKNLQSVSEGGTKCTTYKACADLITKGTDVDYDGLSGPIEFDKNGDVTKASVSIYKYSAGNKSAWVEQVEGTL